MQLRKQYRKRSEKLHAIETPRGVIFVSEASYQAYHKKPVQGELKRFKSAGIMAVAMERAGL